MLTPLLSSFTTSPCVLTLLFPFSAYSLVLLCIETLLIASPIHFSDTILWGAWRTPFFSPKSFTFFTSELSEHTGTCSSYLELHGHWFHPAELQRGVTLKLCWSLCWDLCVSKALLILLDFPHKCWQMYFSLTSILSWFSSLFLDSNNWMVILTLQVSVDFALFSCSPISKQTWFLCMLMTQSLAVLHHLLLSKFKIAVISGLRG